MLAGELDLHQQVKTLPGRCWLSLVASGANKQVNGRGGHPPGEMWTSPRCWADQVLIRLISEAFYRPLTQGASTAFSTMTPGER